MSGFDGFVGAEVWLAMIVKSDDVEPTIFESPDRAEGWIRGILDRSTDPNSDIVGVRVRGMLCDRSAYNPDTGETSRALVFESEAKDGAVTVIGRDSEATSTS